MNLEIPLEKKTTEFETIQEAHRNNPFARIGRMAVCILSLGMIYPNAFVESIDIAAYEEQSKR
jgi:hypothetical protein